MTLSWNNFSFIPLKPLSTTPDGCYYGDRWYSPDEYISSGGYPEGDWCDTHGTDCRDADAGQIIPFCLKYDLYCGEDGRIISSDDWKCKTGYN